jgi:preprotein translocase subunit YajC
VDQLGALLPIALIAAAFWLLIVRPQRARSSAARAVQSRLEVGREVMTTAGLFGTVTSVTDDRVQLEIAPGVVVSYVPAAIAKVIDVPVEAGTEGELPTSSSGDDTPEA